MGSGDFDENQVGVGHPTWVDPLVDLTLHLTPFSKFELENSKISGPPLPYQGADFHIFIISLYKLPCFYQLCNNFKP